MLLQYNNKRFLLHFLAFELLNKQIEETTDLIKYRVVTRANVNNNLLTQVYFNDTCFINTVTYGLACSWKNMQPVKEALHFYPFLM